MKNNTDDKNGYKGATLEAFIDDDEETVTYVIIKTYLAQVDTVDENKDDDTLLDIDFNVFGGQLCAPWNDRSPLATKRMDYVLLPWARTGQG